MSVEIPYIKLLNNIENSNRIIEGIYHKGQHNLWDGKEVLADLILKHGSPNIPKDKVASLNNIFSVIFWGEYAAWNISAELATRLDSFDAKMAATSQAHDEARHFYVMRDYLKCIGCEPKPISSKVSRPLDLVLKTNSVPKKLLGMQLLIEPIAITIFSLVIKSGIDPVLCDLLKYYEKDEARHIALGVKHLPSLIKELSYYKIVDLFLWQLKIMLIEIDGLRELESDFLVLGFSPDDVYNLAEAKQMNAAKEMGRELGINELPWEVMKRVVRLKRGLLKGN
jgi:hypothetical protein